MPRDQLEVIQRTANACPKDLLAGKHLAQLRRELVGLARLAVLAAEEAAVIPREPDDFRAEPFRDASAPRAASMPSLSSPAAMTTRAGAARSASKSGW